MHLSVKVEGRTSVPDAVLADFEELCDGVEGEKKTGFGAALLAAYRLLPRGPAVFCAPGSLHVRRDLSEVALLDRTIADESLLPDFLSVVSFDRSFHLPCPRMHHACHAHHCTSVVCTDQETRRSMTVGGDDAL